MNIPVLYIIGSNDKFVNPISKTKKIKSFNNKNIPIKIMNGLNHWITEKNAKSGTSLYQMDKSTLTEMINWTL
jgi:hypothetical protein